MPSPFAKSRLWRLLAALAATPLLAAALWHLLAALLPFPYDPFQAGRPATFVVTADDGTALRRVLPPDGFDYRPLYRASPDDAIVQALIAVEDARFFRHGGLDPVALLRAIAQNVWAGRRISGASTLSTQVIRLLEPAPRTLPTKLREAFRATQLELRYSKEDILTAYLRLAPFGGNIVGIDAAADRYFATTPDHLALHEAALLAGLPQSPSRSRPDRRPDRALLRRSYVLQRMAECGFVTPAQADAADKQPLVLRTTPAFPSLAPHFCDYVLARRERRPDAPPAADAPTTLSLPLQRIAEHALAAHLAAPPFNAQPRLSGAVVILSATNAAILAMAGSPDYASPNAGQFNACLAPRSPGSTLKPFLYAMAFDRGSLAPASRLSDAPVTFRDFAPQNYSRLSGTTATVREALVQSLNLPAIDLLRRIGVPAFHRFLADGLHLPLRRSAAHYGLGLALGAPDLALLDLAAAYRTLAAPGPFLAPAATPADIAANAADAAANPNAPVSPAAAYLVSDILSGPDRPFDATGHAADVPLPAVAWKTGTSASLRDAWTFAWSPQYVVGVWIGDPSGAPSPLLVGRSAAAPLAWSIFRQIHPDNDAPPFVAPPDVETRTYCPLSGCLATPACPPPLVPDLAIRRRTRLVPCPLHGPDSAARRDARNADNEPSPASDDLAITQPAHGSTLLIPPPSPAIDPSVAFSVRSSRPGRLYWFLDDRLLAFAPSPFRWAPVPGEHVLVVVHPDGPSASASFTVLPPP